MKFKKVLSGYDRRQVDAEIKRLEDAIAEQKSYIESLRSKSEELQREVDGFKTRNDMIGRSIIAALGKADEIEGAARIRYNQEVAHLRAFHERWLTRYNELLAAYPLDGDLYSLREFNDCMSRLLKPQESAAGDQYRSETERLGERKRRLGYTDIETGDQDGEEDYDPVTHIREYLARHPDLRGDGKQDSNADKPTVSQIDKGDSKKNDKRSSRSNKSKASRPKIAEKDARRTLPPSKLGSSDSGFSFEEALNPTDNLDDIMKDLGLL